MYTCADCGIHACREKEHENMPKNCPMRGEELVKEAEKNNSDELKFRINYAYSFGKDSASINWKSSDVFTIDLSGKDK